MSHVLILGGTSEIGEEVAARLAPGNRVTLAARRVDALGPVEERMYASGATDVHRLFFDADDIAAQPAVLDEAWAHEPVDTAVIAFGILGNQEQDEISGEKVAAVIHTDFTAHAAVVTELVNRMESGHILAFSSIAGSRVRRANYVYGSAKAGLDGFLQGMQDRLHGTPIRLTIARPGFVIGRMTDGMKPAPMSSTPDQVADEAVKALGTPHVWIPFGVGVLGWISQWVPRAIWRRMPR